MAKEKTEIILQSIKEQEFEAQNVISTQKEALTKVVNLQRENEETLTNIDAIIGRIAIVSEEIDPKTNTGRVKLDGDDWKAESEDGNPHESGERVRIVSRDGITVRVKGLEADN